MNVLCPTLLSTAAEVKKSARVQTLLTAALEESLFMLHLSDDERNLLVRVMQQEIVMEGAYIIRQGEMGDFYYIAESGHVEFVDHGRTVGRCGPGGAFGELALLYVLCCDSVGVNG
jgi:cAMP-dependent protein kinase regulator